MKIECMMRFRSGLRACLLGCLPRYVGAFRVCWNHPSCEYPGVLRSLMPEAGRGLNRSSVVSTAPFATGSLAGTPGRWTSGPYLSFGSWRSRGSREVRLRAGGKISVVACLAKWYGCFLGSAMGPTLRAPPHSVCSGSATAGKHRLPPVHVAKGRGVETPAARCKRGHAERLRPDPAGFCDHGRCRARCPSDALCYAKCSRLRPCPSWPVWWATPSHGTWRMPGSAADTGALEPVHCWVPRRVPRRMGRAGRPAVRLVRGSRPMGCRRLGRDRQRRRRPPATPG